MPKGPAYGRGWKSKRRRVLDRDGWICALCGADLKSPGVTPSVDHIDPVVELVDAGMNVTPDAIDMDSLRALCRPCNSRLGARTTNRRKRSNRAPAPRVWGLPIPGPKSSSTGSPWGDVE